MLTVMQRLDPKRTTWHITWGTYGSRLHGGDRPTVDRKQTLYRRPFVERDERFEQREKNWMTAPAVLLTTEQRLFVEAVMPNICNRGGWNYRICAGGPERDHVHVLCDLDRTVHGKDARRWMKRWLTEAMDKRWTRPGSGSWWAEGGSAKVVADEPYLRNVFDYLFEQRAAAQK